MEQGLEPSIAAQALAFRRVPRTTLIAKMQRLGLSTDVPKRVTRRSANFDTIPASRRTTFERLERAVPDGCPTRLKRRVRSRTRARAPRRLVSWRDRARVAASLGFARNAAIASSSRAYSANSPAECSTSRISYRDGTHDGASDRHKFLLKGGRGGCCVRGRAGVATENGRSVHSKTAFISSIVRERVP